VLSSLEVRSVELAHYISMERGGKSVGVDV
jgi:hypothetical protein